LRYQYEVGELVCVKAGASVYSNNLARLDIDTHFSIEKQFCLVLDRDGGLNQDVMDRYLVFLQQDQIQGWIYCFELEKLNG
jgi:hypothetical protein